MKQVFRITFLSWVLILYTHNFYAQDITNYSFSTETGAALYNMTGSTQIVAKQIDENKSAITNIGFNFYFERTLYTQFSVESNGMLRLGGTQVTVENANSITSTTNRPKMMTFWDDLSTGNNGKIHYKLIGSAPNRILVVEFNMYYNWGIYTDYNQTSQICLYEGTNEIVFIYGSGITNTNSATIGIGGSNASKYLVRTDLTNHTFGNSSPVQNINTWPGSGRKYRFIPGYNTWTGAVSTSWETTGNWSWNVVPKHMDRVLIPVTSNQPVINSVDSVYRLHTNSGTQVAVNTGHFTVVENIENGSEIVIDQATLTVRGDYQANDAFTTFSHLNGALELSNQCTAIGNVSVDKGTIAFIGSVQSVPATNYYNLLIKNNGIKTLTGNVQLYGSLTVQGSNCQLNLEANSLSVKKDLNILTYNGLDMTNSNAELICNGNTNQYLNHAGADEGMFRKFTLNKTNGELILLNHVTISSSLNLNSGIIELNGYNLTLGTATTNAVVTGGNSQSFVRAQVDGAVTSKLIHHIHSVAGTIYFFPIGQSEYNPVNVTLKNGNLSNATIEVWTKNSKVTTMNNSMQCYINRSWFVEPTGIANPTYDIDFTYGSNEFIGDYFVDLVPVKLSSGNWFAPNNSVLTCDINQGEGNHDVGLKKLSWTDLSTFSEFGGAGGSVPLPVELMNYQVNCSNNQIEILWSTASEFNSDYFNIVFSEDAENWINIGKVKSVGNSQSIVDYRFISRETSTPGYYRLQQVDIDGKEKSYSPVYVSCLGNEEIKIFPNPSVGVANLLVPSSQNSHMEVIVYNSKGIRIGSKTCEVQEGVNIYNLNDLLRSKDLYLIDIIIENRHVLIKHSVVE